MSLVIYGHFTPKLEIIKFSIPIIIFSFAIFNILSIKKELKNKFKVVLFFAILFGLFNGLGSSTDVLFKLESNEREFIPIIQVVLGAGGAILLTTLALLTLETLLKKLPKINSKKLTLVFSIIIWCLTIPLIFGQVFS